MPVNRKLGRKSDIRRSMLRGMVTSLIVNGKIETTRTRALEVRSIAEKLITLAVKQQANFEVVEVNVTTAKLDEKGRKILQTATSKNDRTYDKVVRETVSKTVTKDHKDRLAARRQILSFMVEQKDAKGKKINTVNHLFNEVAPKYLNRPGGYTRIIKLGQRRGDAAEMVILQLVD